MTIDQDQMIHGGALIQIAEHPQFTAINSLTIGNKKFAHVYKINDHISIYFKYSRKPKSIFKEYLFTFKNEHLRDLAEIAKVNQSNFIGLVCVDDREVCVLSYEALRTMVEQRRLAAGRKEDQYVVAVTAQPRKRLRAYVNAPGKKKTILGKAIVVSRKAFPDVLFSMG